MQPAGGSSVALVAFFGLALAGCGMIPRSDYVEGATIVRTYPLELNKLASCAFDKLDQAYGSVRKTDFPDRKAVRLDLSVQSYRMWEIEFVSEAPNRTRAVVPIPPIVGKMQPEQLFKVIEPCGPSS